ncbi:MAG: type II toxin-antitoxin system HicA family toxin [Anaerolineae bacterium]
MQSTLLACPIFVIAMLFSNYPAYLPVKERVLRSAQEALANIEDVAPAGVWYCHISPVLEDYGFEYRQTVGSHHIFSYFLGGQSKLLVVPFKRPLKPIYVKRALKVIDQIIQEQGEDGSDDD